MICNTCQLAGRVNTHGKSREAEQMHRMCVANYTTLTGHGTIAVNPTQCDCQHKVGGGWINGARAKPADDVVEPADVREPAHHEGGEGSAESHAVGVPGPARIPETAGAFSG